MKLTDRRSERHLLTPFMPHLNPATIEIVVNRPNEIGVETREGWTWYEVDLPYRNCRAIGILSAFMDGKDLSPSKPIMTAKTPFGQRIHVNHPPVTKPGIVAINIRVPSENAPTMEWLFSTGMFTPPRPPLPVIPPLEIEGLDSDLAARLTSAVYARRNVLIAGATNSGKTTLMGALIDAIPDGSRIITIQDADELDRIRHRNHVSLHYNADDLDGIQSDQLLKSTLRMRPDRVLMGELRGREAWTYLNSVVKGHPGGISTLHADSAAGAFDALETMVRMHPEGQSMPDSVVTKLLRTHVDVVVHLKRDEKTKRISVTGVYER